MIALPLLIAMSWLIVSRSQDASSSASKPLHFAGPLDHAERIEQTRMTPYSLQELHGWFGLTGSGPTRAGRVEQPVEVGGERTFRVYDPQVGDGRFAYEGLPAYASLQALGDEVTERSVNQFGVDYLGVLDGPLALTFDGDDAAALAGAQPAAGEWMWWSNRGRWEVRHAHSRLQFERRLTSHPPVLRLVRNGAELRLWLRDRFGGWGANLAHAAGEDDHGAWNSQGCVTHSLRRAESKQALSAAEGEAILPARPLRTLRLRSAE